MRVWVDDECVWEGVGDEDEHMSVCGRDVREEREMGEGGMAERENRGNYS